MDQISISQEFIEFLFFIGYGVVLLLFILLFGLIVVFLRKMDPDSKEDKDEVIDENYY